MKVREDVSLDSAFVRELPTNSFVCVLDRATASNGTQRACVAMAQPQTQGALHGPCTTSVGGGKEKKDSAARTPLGWVSLDAKNGRGHLVPFHWARFQKERKPADVPSPDAAARLAASLRLAAAQAACSTEGGGAPGATRTRASTTPAASFDATSGAAPQADAAREPKLGWGKVRMSVMKRAAESGAEGSAAAGASGMASSSKASKDAKADAREAADRFKPQSSKDVRALAAELERDVKVEEAKLTARHKTFGTVLGEVLLDLNKSKVRPRMPLRPVPSCSPMWPLLLPRPTLRLHTPSLPLRWLSSSSRGGCPRGRSLRLSSESMCAHLSTGQTPKTLMRCSRPSMLMAAGRSTCPS